MNTNLDNIDTIVLAQEDTVCLSQPLARGGLPSQRERPPTCGLATGLKSILQNEHPFRQDLYICSCIIGSGNQLLVEAFEFQYERPPTCALASKS